MPGQFEYLEKYTQDLTQRARDGQLDPVIGREPEIRLSIEVLAVGERIIRLWLVSQVARRPS